MDFNTIDYTKLSIWIIFTTSWAVYCFCVFYTSIIEIGVEVGHNREKLIKLYKTAMVSYIVGIISIAILLLFWLLS